MLLSVVLVSKRNTTLLTLVIPVHLKPLGITVWFHTDLNGLVWFGLVVTLRVSACIAAAIVLPLPSRTDYMGGSKLTR